MIYLLIILYSIYRLQEIISEVDIALHKNSHGNLTIIAGNSSSDWLTPQDVSMWANSFAHELVRSTSRNISFGVTIHNVLDWLSIQLGAGSLGMILRMETDTVTPTNLLHKLTSAELRERVMVNFAHMFTEYYVYVSIHALPSTCGSSFVPVTEMMYDVARNSIRNCWFRIGSTSSMICQYIHVWITSSNWRKARKMRHNALFLSEIENTISSALIPC